LIELNKEYFEMMERKINNYEDQIKLC
jgi:hypothetical protein